MQLKNYKGGKNLTLKRLHGPTTWKGMLKNALRDIANWQTKRQSSCTKCQALAWMTINLEELESVGELSEVCLQIVLKCLYLVRIGRPDILWSVNKLARSVTKWTQACDRRLARLTSYIHHTSYCRQYCHVGNTAQRCRLGLIQDSHFAGDLEDSKSTSGGVLCIFGRRTFVLVSWMCKKQSSVSHTESEIISLDAGLRMDWLPALDLWDMVIEVLRSTNNPTMMASGKLVRFSNPKSRSKKTNEGKKLIKCLTWIMYPLTHLLLKVSLSSTFLKTSKLSSK